MATSLVFALTKSGSTSIDGAVFIVGAFPTEPNHALCEIVNASGVVTLPRDWGRCICFPDAFIICRGNRGNVSLTGSPVSMTDLLSGKVTSIDCNPYSLTLVQSPQNVADTVFANCKPFLENFVPKPAPAVKPASWTPGAPPPSFDWMTRPLQEMIK